MYLIDVYPSAAPSVFSVAQFSIFCVVFCGSYFVFLSFFIWPLNHIGGFMVSVLVSSAEDCGFEHTALRSKSKDWLAGNQDVSE